MLSPDAIRAVFPKPLLPQETEDAVEQLVRFVQGSSNVLPQAMPVEQAFFHRIVERVRIYFLEEPFRTPDSLEAFALYLQQAFDATICPQRLSMFEHGEKSEIFVEQAFAALSKSIAPRNLQYLLDKHLEINTISNGDISILGMLVKFGLGPEVKIALSRALPREISFLVSSFHESDEMLSAGFKWIDERLNPKLAIVVGNEDAGMASSGLRGQFVQAVSISRAKTLCKLISQDLTPADIICSDLQGAINHNSSLTGSVVAEFSKDFFKENLNVGVETSQILLLYLRVVRVMSRIEPTSMVEDIAEPMRRCLKERADTIVAIVSTLFGPNVSANELRNLLDSGSVVDNLLSIYENKEVFTKQLAVQFSEQLLVSESLEEVADLREKAELLESHFGEWQLQNIHVMISDIENSSNIAEQVHEVNSELNALSPLILSRLYWPGLSREGQLRLPPAAQGLINNFADEYKQLTDEQRVLKWLPTMGRVHVLVQLSDRNLELRVTPEQASLLCAFQDHGGELSMHQLENATGLTGQSLLSTLQFWIDQRVIGADFETYKIMETEAEADQLSEAVVSSNTQQNTINSAKKATQEMDVYWSYIQGMLRNLGSLPVDRIHSFLTMLVPKDDPYVKTKEELETFLLSLVEEEKLACIDGKYSLN